MDKIETKTINQIEVYGRQVCHNCNIVKNILQEKNINFIYTDLDSLPPERIVDLKHRLDYNLGRLSTTLPIIFVDGKQIFWTDFIESLK